MFGDNPKDEQLKESWHAFCEEFKGAGDLVFRDATPSDDITRAKGMRILARNISLALQFQLENNDPNFPELLHYFDPLRKQGTGQTCWTAGRRGPMRCIEDIYQHFGMALSETASSRMLTYLEGRLKGKFGKHAYQIDKQRSKDRAFFARYQQQYDVPDEI